MHFLFRIIYLYIVVLIACISSAMAQQEQSFTTIKGKKVTLKANLDIETSFLWFKNGEPINGNHDSILIVTESGVYTVIALGEGCNSDESDPVVIVFDEQAEEVTVDIEIKQTVDNAQIQLGEQFSYQIYLYNNSGNEAHELHAQVTLPRAVKYASFQSNGNQSIVYNPSKHQVDWRLDQLKPYSSEMIYILVDAKEAGFAQSFSSVSVREKDHYLPNNKDSVSVHIVAFKIPNVFSPNGDGVNDFFEIVGIQQFKSNQLTIFNRFGNVVYDQKEYANQWTAEGLADGTYYYILKLDAESGKSQTFKGYITVIRKITTR